MEKVCPWCGQPSDRGLLKKRTVSATGLFVRKVVTYTEKLSRDLKNWNIQKPRSVDTRKCSLTNEFREAEGWLNPISGILNTTITGCSIYKSWKLISHKRRYYTPWKARLDRDITMSMLLMVISLSSLNPSLKTPPLLAYFAALACETLVSENRR